MSTLQDLFNTVENFGFKVRINNAKGDKAWEEIKPYLPESEQICDDLEWKIERVAVDDKPIGCLRKIYDYVHDELHMKGGDEDKPKPEKWEHQHFFLQLIRIPRNYPLELRRLCQIAYNLGQLRAVYSDPIYTPEVKTYYYKNKLDNINSYVDLSSCVSKDYSENISNINKITKIEKIELKGGSFNYYSKYLKYKNKYSSLKNKMIGGSNGLEKMPQLCFGTAQNNLINILPQALGLGYRHIDGAEMYSTFRGNSNYYENIKNAIKVIPREQLWITWKDNNITVEKIKIICEKLNCEYIDLFLIHHNYGEKNDFIEFIEFKKAQRAKLIRYYGVSNCEDLTILKTLKDTHNIFANQIQARPPSGKIDGRSNMPHNFIEKCNEININIMLYSPISGVTQSDTYFTYLDVYDSCFFRLFFLNINKYYIQKYLLCNNNVIITASTTTTNLEININLFINIINNKDKLNNCKMIEIEQFLQKFTLADQG
jgi:diketogulonate reductase-like aldo/keto reductase